MDAYVALLASLFLVDLLAAMSPGPNFIVVSMTAATGSRREAFAAVGGILTANLGWALAVVLGLATLFVVVPPLYTAIKIAGGAYLIYLGIRLWRGADQPAGDHAPRQPASRSLAQAYSLGFLTSATNPKSVVYFGSVFAVFLGPGLPAWLQSAAVGIVIFNGLIWYGLVATLFSTARARRQYAAIRRPLDRIAAAAIGAFGARLILVRD